MSRFRLLLPLLALALLPSVGRAQYPGMGGGGLGGRVGRMGNGRPGRGGQGAGEGSATIPTRADIEKHDPILVLLAKRNDLALADSQIVGLQRIDATLMEQNRPLLAEVDSLHASGPGDGGDNSTAAQRARFAEQRRSFLGLLHDIREHHDSATASALALLSDAQRPKATRLLDDEKKAMDEAMGGGKRGLPPGMPGRQGSGPPE